MIAAFVATFIAFQVADGVTTILALRRPGLGEGNPIAANLFAQFGVAPCVVALKVVAVALAVVAATSELPPSGIMAALGVGIVLTGWAAADNYRLLRKHRSAK